MSAHKVIAKLAIGEALDGATGVLILSGSAEEGFRVHVSGGLLPNGLARSDFDGEEMADALEFFLACGRELAVDAIECAP